MQKKYIYGTVFALLLLNQLSAQDRHFSQYNELSSVINPALAGVQYDTKVTGAYKTQWGSVAKAYQTFGVAYEQSIKYKKLKGNHLAVSASIFRDMAGTAKLGNINPNIGVCVVRKLSKTMRASGGFQAGFRYTTIDVTQLTWDKQFNGYVYDGALPSGESAVPRSAITSYDMGAGLNFSYAQSEKFISSKDGNKMNVGFSAFHFNNPKNSFYTSSERLMERYCFYANGDINIPKSKNAIMPSLIYMKQGPSSEFLLGALFKFILVDQSLYTTIKKPSAFSLGAQYRYKDAIIPTVLWQYDKYAVGISYDINVSALTPASKRNGGLEVMLRYNTSPGYGRNLGRGDTKASY